MHLYTGIIDFTFIFLAHNWNFYLYILCPALFLLLKWSAFYVSLYFTLFLSLSVSLLLSLYLIETAFISLRLNRSLYLLLKSFAMSYENIWRIRNIYIYTHVCIVDIWLILSSSLEIIFSVFVPLSSSSVYLLSLSTYLNKIITSSFSVTLLSNLKAHSLYLCFSLFLSVYVYLYYISFLIFFFFISLLSTVTCF